jgi:hypothetical protein
MHWQQQHSAYRGAIMSRALLYVASVAAAGALAATPAIVGLHGNPSFTQRLPVHVPAKAHRVTFTVDSMDRAKSGDDRRSVHASPTKGDDRAADDRTGQHRARDDRAGDDRAEHHGNTASPSAVDDHRGSRTITISAQPRHRSDSSRDATEGATDDRAERSSASVPPSTSAPTNEPERHRGRDQSSGSVEDKGGPSADSDTASTDPSDR